MNAAAQSGSGPLPCILAYVRRPRARAVMRTAFPRRKCRLLLARSANDCAAALTTSLVDAVVVDFGGADDGTWRVAALAREFPSAAFFGLTPLRVSEGSVPSAAASFELVDVFVEGVDDAVMRRLVFRDGFGARFARAMDDPPPALLLDTALQRAAWRFMVQNAAQPIRTAALASELNVTREHLSRIFSANGSPNLKRVIDLVRLLVAAELAKNPGHDLRDVARVLAFASPSHLSATALRISGTKPASLARLRAVDLIGRFVRWHGRSRG